uniref:Uncharacterized protein n=1 Tax=Kalanchoe fedtschenkoi TaxID=63787 RepID=A0A7N0ULD7_KALFE
MASFGQYTSFPNEYTPQQQPGQHYSPYPPPPPPDSMYPPPPPPPRPQPPYLHFSHFPPPRPSPTSSSSSIPPPPPPLPRQHHRHQKPPIPLNKRLETLDEGTLIRKKREMEKLRKHSNLKEPHNTNHRALSSSASKAASLIASHLPDRKTNPLLTSDRAENKLKKPTTFLCKMNTFWMPFRGMCDVELCSSSQITLFVDYSIYYPFLFHLCLVLKPSAFLGAIHLRHMLSNTYCELRFWNELPDASSQIKLMTLPKENDRFTKYTITSLEKTFKPELHVDGDLGIPLDLLDLSVYNPPKDQPPMDLEDEELLRDDEEVTHVKIDGIRKKERPIDKGLSWLSLTEKQAKELRERRGKNILDNFASRERKIQNIEASFEAAKLHPIHQTKPHLHPIEILPLFPDFDRYNDQFVIAAIMKSFVGPSKKDPDKFLAYMVPQPNELSKDMFDEHEEMSYSWIQGEDVEDPTTYLVAFDEDEARYLPLSTKLMLGKKKARDGRSEGAEQFQVPANVTMRRRSEVFASELKDVARISKGGSNSRSRGGRLYRSDDEHDMDDDQGTGHEMYQNSGAHDDISD